MKYNASERLQTAAVRARYGTAHRTAEQSDGENQRKRHSNERVEGAHIATTASKLH